MFIQAVPALMMTMLIPVACHVGTVFMILGSMEPTVGGHGIMPGTTHGIMDMVAGMEPMTRGIMDIQDGMTHGIMVIQAGMAGVIRIMAMAGATHTIMEAVTMQVYRVVQQDGVAGEVLARIETILTEVG